MKIFIPSHGRPEAITTHLLWPKESEDYYVVVHSAEDKLAYSKTVEPKRIIVSGMPLGMGVTRKWIHETLVSEGETYMCMDDNIKAITAFPDPFYSLDKIAPIDLQRERKNLTQEVTWGKFLALRAETMIEADNRGARLVGFAPIENPYFRGKKFRDVGFVIGQMFVTQKAGASFDGSVVYKEDYDFTASHLLNHGRVLINNYIWPKKKHYQAGGCGSLEQRTPTLVQASELLMKKYPGLFRYNDKRNGFDQKAEILLRFSTVDQVQKWRMWMRHYQKQEAVHGK